MALRLLNGGTIWLGEDCIPRHGWLLVDTDRVCRTGGADDPLPSASEVVELAGRHVLPGFVDAHTHLTVAAWMSFGDDGSSWRNLTEALGAVRRAASADPRSPWLLFWNVSLHAWPEGRLPTAEELDAAAPGRRVLVSGIDLHRGTVSRAALDDFGFLTRRERGPHAEDLSRGRRGKPTGELWEALYGSVLRRALADTGAYIGDVGVAGALRAEARRHLAHGITHAHDPYVPAPLHDRLLELRRQTALRLSWATGSAEGLLNPPEDPGTAPEGPYGEAGREVKIFLDGADRCALRLPLRALPGLLGGTAMQAWRQRSPGPLREGMRRRVTLHGTRLDLPYLRLTEGELMAIVSKYAEAGFSVRLHALGNLAVEQAASALAAAHIPAGTATIDHLTALDPRSADLVAASGAYASYQPGFLPRFGPQFAAAGIDRHLSILGGRLIARSGAPLVLSSDHPCGPLSPLHNLRAAVGRAIEPGRTLQPGEALTPSEAVRAATVGAARSLHAAGSLGLSAGQVADLVICTGDPFEDGTSVAETWVDGECAWRL